MYQVQVQPEKHCKTMSQNKITTNNNNISHKILEGKKKTYQSPICILP